MKKVQHNHNNFDFIRFLAAVLVIESHATQLTGIGVSYTKLFTHSVSLGNLCVDVFFMVSGYLILSSYLRLSNLKQYLISRILRIYPALIVAVLITALIIVPFFTSTSLTNYYSDPTTWRYLLNAIMPFHEMIDGINGFNTGTNNIYASMVNGALWTIGWEVKCYLLIIILAMSKLLRYKFIILAISMSLIIKYNFDGDVDACRFYGFFMLGMGFYLFREQIIFNHKLTLAISIISLITASYFNTCFLIVWAISGGYLLFSFAFNNNIKLNNFGKFGDFSYGIYLYGFVIQQILIVLNHGKMDNVVNFIIAFPIAILCGVLSYKFIEKPCMNLKRKLI